MKNFSKKAAVILGSVGVIAGAATTVALQTHAQTSTTDTTSVVQQRQHGTPPAAMGQVTAVSGNTVTVTDQKTGTTFSVDASSASIEKFSEPTTPPTGGTRPTGTTITVSQIAVGDTVMVEGTISGASIAATKIIDGLGFGRGGRGHMGEHGAIGTVTSVNGNTITLTGKNGTTYIVEAGSSTFKKITDSSLSEIKTGDTLRVDGTVSGTTITAKNITSGTFPEQPQQ